MISKRLESNELRENAQSEQWTLAPWQFR